MPNSTPPNLPQDMRDLLIKLDVKVEMGFDGVNKKLEKIEERQSVHENELTSVKTRVTAIETDRKALIPDYKDALKTIDANTRRIDVAEGAVKMARWGIGIVVLVLLAVLAQLWTDHRQQAQLQSDLQQIAQKH